MLSKASISSGVDDVRTVRGHAIADAMLSRDRFVNPVEVLGA